MKKKIVSWLVGWFYGMLKPFGLSNTDAIDFIYLNFSMEVIDFFFKKGVWI